MTMTSISVPARKDAPVNTTAAASDAGWMRVVLGRSFQILGGLFFAVVVPAFLRWPVEVVHLSSSSPRNTLIGTAVAVIAGYIVLHKLTRFPGIKATAYIFPTFIVSYGTLIAIFFFTRMDYARFQMLSSCALALTWFYWAYLVEQRVRRPQLAVVPVGAGRELMAIPSIEWSVVPHPRQRVETCDGVVADLRAEMSPDWEKFLAQCALQGVPVYHFKQLGESLTGRVQIEHLSENNLGSLLPSSVYARAKRTLDLAGALLVLPVALAVTTVVAVLIKLDSPGPVFFTQPRVGYRGQVFTIVKFRTMHCGRLRGAQFTGGHDPRITRVGGLLRRFRIDELPQIVNVLKGEMSWIGPRPEALPLSEWYEREIPFYSYRHIVRPGITGWAQVQQGYAARIKAVTDKLHYDFYYIKHFSPWLDLLIMAKTVRTVLTGFGAR